MDSNDCRTTLDRFNAELAILDRPLEDDIEYYDDPRPRRLWQRIGATLGAFTLLGAVAAFAVTRWSSPAAATEAVPRAALSVPGSGARRRLPSRSRPVCRSRGARQSHRPPPPPPPRVRPLSAPATSWPSRGAAS